MDKQYINADGRGEPPSLVAVLELLTGYCYCLSSSRDLRNKPRLNTDRANQPTSRRTDDSFTSSSRSFLLLLLLVLNSPLSLSLHSTLSSLLSL